MDKEEVYDRSVRLHDRARGKIEITSRVPLKTREDLALAYTPGVAQPCREIARDPGSIYRYTRKWNSVAIVTDGSAVLGLGDIGAAAALPVMEGKAILFKEFGGVDAFPVCLDSHDVREIVRTVTILSPVFGGINLEDISSPRCFAVERELQRRLDIPVFHDDQHGTAVVVGAALLNALKVVEKKLDGIRIVINGAGAAGIAISKFLHEAGVREIVLCDRAGIVCASRTENMNEEKKKTLAWLMAGKTGTLADAMKESDVFIGVSGPGLVTREMVSAMAERPVVFAMANPVPEIMPDDAKEAGACVVGTGRSDFANQINNLLAFPGIFRGAFDARAKAITGDMKIAASRAIAEYVPEKDLGPDCVIPDALDKGVADSVARAVATAADREEE